MTQDNSIVIREYLTTDKEVVINLIKLNTPNFFAKEEVNDLSNYLDKGIELYYVLLVDGKVVGCGGGGKSEINGKPVENSTFLSK
jgi:[ribosomal protein S18]-alanine N-acetyltransferase